MSVILVSCTRNIGGQAISIYTIPPLPGQVIGSVSRASIVEMSTCLLSMALNVASAGFLVKVAIVLIDASGYRSGRIWYVLSER
jgi:hypothetical protein